MTSPDLYKRKEEKLCPLCEEGIPMSTNKIFEGYHFDANKKSGDLQVWSEYTKCWRLEDTVTRSCGQ